jgi:hypothetical protein
MWQSLLFLVDFPGTQHDFDLEINNRWWSWRQIRLEDPSISEPLFVDRLKPHVERVWKALRDGHPEQLRALVSDGLYRGLVAQRDLGEPFEEVTQGRPGLEGLVLDAIRHDPSFEVAVARPSWFREPKSNTLSWAVSGKWFFRRRRGARSREDGHGLWEARCPQCGSPLDIADRVRCEYCGAIVNSGDHDWILTSILEGDHEYEVFTMPGLEELRRRDPGFLPEALEDRVIAMFWSLRRGSAENMRWFLTENPSLPADSDPPGRPFLEDVRVRMIQSDGKFDRAITRVRWRIGPYLTIPYSFRDTPKAIKFREDRIDQDYVLIRESTAQTPIIRGLNSFGCSGCGAPLGAGDTCAYCGTPPSSSAEWRLEAVRPHVPVELPAMWSVPVSYGMRTRELFLAVLNDLAKAAGADSDTYVWRLYLSHVFGFGKIRRMFLGRSPETVRGLDPALRPVLFGLALQMFADSEAVRERSVTALRALAAALEIPEADREHAIELARLLQERLVALKKKSEATSQA